MVFSREGTKPRFLLSVGISIDNGVPALFVDVQYSKKFARNKGSILNHEGLSLKPSSALDHCFPKEQTKTGF